MIPRSTQENQYNHKEKVVDLGDYYFKILVKESWRELPRKLNLMKPSKI